MNIDEELKQKRPANAPAVVKRTRALTVYPAGSTVVRGRTQAEVLKKVNKLSRRGYVAGTSRIGQFSAQAGGGYGVKVALAKPLPQPVPAWAKGATIVGTVMIGLSAVGIALLHALAAIPWGMVAGGALAFLLAVAAVKRLVFGSSITIVQKVTIR